jgi:arylsulfatase
VLLVTIDTLRADHVSAIGGDLPTTPFLDTLIGQGVLFDDVWTTVPRTTPALASLLTGAYPHTTHVRTLYDCLDAGVATVAEAFRARGYTTVAVVSNHVLVRERGLDRGFDVYDTADDARDAEATNAAVFARLAALGDIDRLFLWVHYIDPHVPYMPPPELARSFDPGYTGRYALAFGSVKGGIGDAAYPKDLPKTDAVFRNRLPAEVNAHIRRLYAADVRSTDDAVAELVARLKAELGKDWLVVVTADHGESLGEHDFFYDHGDYVYEPGLRVALAFVFPPGDSRAKPRVIDDRVSLVDVAPTLDELFSLGLPPRQLEGRSLVPFLEGGAMAPRAVFAECGHSFYRTLIRRRVGFTVAGRFRAAALGRWKLIWTPGQVPERRYELYDLASDPGETRDLYRAGDREAERLRALLAAWLRPVESRDERMTDEDRERLRSLGYLD